MAAARDFVSIDENSVEVRQTAGSAGDAFYGIHHKNEDTEPVLHYICKPR